MTKDIRRLAELRRRRFEPTTTSPGLEALDRFERRGFGDTSIAELFHEATKDAKHRPTETASRVRFVTERPFALAQAKLPPDKPGTDRISLPDPVELSVGLDDALGDRRSRRTFGGDPLSVREIATLLGHSCGTTRSSDVADGVEQSFRAYPSAGALYPVHVHLIAVQGTEELSAGIYWYDPDDHALVRQREADPALADDLERAFEPAADIFDLWSVAAVVVLTGAFVRSMAKYGPLGYRFALQESGHVAQNLLTVATAVGASAFPSAAYDDELDDLLDVDGIDEATIYTVPVGVPPGDGDG
jgi:SagB-type dehydrogenase family enzyme